MYKLSKWWKPGAPGELRSTPWLHPAAVAYIEMLLEPKFRVLEHGGGGSTLWFSDRVAEVVTHEHDDEYLLALSKVVPDNVSLRRDKPHGHDLEPHSFDLMLIDGTRDNRVPWAMQAAELVKPGGVVVFDNPNRPDHNYPRGRNYLRAVSAHHITFEVNPPGHSYATTDFYRMPGGVDWI